MYDTREISGMKRFLGMALVAAALAVPGRMAAQASVTSVIGDSVRVTAPSVEPGIRGVLVAVRDDSLFVRRHGRTIAVPLSQVEWVEVRRRRSALGGLLRGVLIGAPVGLATGYLTGELAEGNLQDCADDCGLLPVIYGAAGLVTGTVLGGMIGVTTPGGRWRHVATRPSVGIAPARGGMALSLRAEL
jgi:hypothetical protein